jgi:hypothetical protein
MRGKTSAGRPVEKVKIWGHHTYFFQIINSSRSPCEMFTPWDVKLSHRGLIDYLTGVYFASQLAPPAPWDAVAIPSG